MYSSISFYYNENDYINLKIENNGMIVNGNIILVDGWQFEIDRSIPQIKGNLGKGSNIVPSLYLAITLTVCVVSGSNSSFVYSLFEIVAISICIFNILF